MLTYKNALTCLLFFCGLMIGQSVQAQITLKGRAYVDYQYILASPDSDEEGENGFEYRRLYLTSNYKISDTFSGRARLEANGKDGVPFVKDLYLKWKGALGDGHDLTMGITEPPSFTVAESGWGYRSLEKTILDRNKIVSSRDFGVRANGKLTSDGSLKYGLMVGNNTRLNDSDKYKRFYSQLEWYPTDEVSVTTAADYSSSSDVDFLNLHVFAGFNPGTFRCGVEGFFRQGNMDEGDESLDTFGVSLFGIAPINDKWEFVGRIDRVENDFGGVTDSENFVLAALAYKAEKGVMFMPNVLFSKFSDVDDPFVAGRMTMEVKF